MSKKARFVAWRVKGERFTSPKGKFHPVQGSGSYSVYVSAKYGPVGNRKWEEIEDGENRVLFSAIGAEAAKNARNENRALGLDDAIVEDGKIIRKKPDGSVEVLRVLEKGTGRRFQEGAIKIKGFRIITPSKNTDAKDGIINE